MSKWTKRTRTCSSTKRRESSNPCNFPTMVRVEVLLLIAGFRKNIDLDSVRRRFLPRFRMPYLLDASPLPYIPSALPISARLSLWPSLGLRHCTSENACHPCICGKSPVVIVRTLTPVRFPPTSILTWATSRTTLRQPETPRCRAYRFPVKR
jgi:hypothetical protein